MMDSRPATREEDIRLWIAFLPAGLTRLFFWITIVAHPDFGYELALRIMEEAEDSLTEEKE